MASLRFRTASLLVNSLNSVYPFGAEDRVHLTTQYPTAVEDVGIALWFVSCVSLLAVSVLLRCGRSVLVRDRMASTWGFFRNRPDVNYAYSPR